MAFHTGDLERLDWHLHRDPQLLHRRWAYRDIYPPSLGCADDFRSGLHGTPVDGTTLLSTPRQLSTQKGLAVTRRSIMHWSARPMVAGGNATPIWCAGYWKAVRILTRG